MRRIKLLTLTGIAVLSASAFASATASAALPEFLGTLPTKFTVAGGTAKLTSGATTVTCTSSQGSGEVTNNKSGHFDELFLNCVGKAGGLTLKCTGLNDTVTGSILAKGTFLLGYELGTTNAVQALTLGPEVHFECSALLVTVKGCFEGKFSPKNVLTTEGKLEGTNTALEDYTNDQKAAVTCLLLSSVNAGTFVLSVQEVKVTLKDEKALEVMA